MRRRSIPFLAVVGILLGVLFAALVAPHHPDNADGNPPSISAPPSAATP